MDAWLLLIFLVSLYFEFARKEVIIVLSLLKKTSVKFNTNVLNITA